MTERLPDHRAHPIIGWREWIALPHLGIQQIKAKVDTGARSSALHVFELETFEQQEKTMLRFKIHPEQKNDACVVEAEAELLDQREVRNSGGQAELRCCIRTDITLNDQTWPIELTLTNRDNMGFRMLLGREAVRGRFLVDAGQSFIQSGAERSTLEQQRP